MTSRHKVPECRAVIAPMKKCLEMLLDDQITTRGPTTISRVNISCYALYMAGNLTAYLLLYSDACALRVHAYPCLKDLGLPRLNFLQ